MWQAGVEVQSPGQARGLGTRQLSSAVREAGAEARSPGETHALRGRGGLENHRGAVTHPREAVVNHGGVDTELLSPAFFRDFLKKTVFKSAFLVWASRKWRKMLGDSSNSAEPRPHFSQFWCRTKVPGGRNETGEPKHS